MNTLTWTRGAPSHSGHLHIDSEADEESRPLVVDSEYNSHDQENNSSVRLSHREHSVSVNDDGGSEESTLLAGPQRKRRKRRASPQW